MICISAYLSRIYLWLSGRAWRRWIAAFALGGVTVLALPRYTFAPALLLSLPALIVLIDLTCELTDRKTQAASGLRKRLVRARAMGALGWAFGTGFHTFGMYWTGVSFLVRDVVVELMPLLVFAGCALIGASFIPAFALISAFWSYRPARIAVFAIGWMLSEQFRAWFVSWNSLGLTAFASDTFAQGMALIGMHGMAGVVVLIASLPALMHYERGRKAWRRPAVAVIWASAAASSVFFFAYGTSRLAGNDALTDAEHPTWIRVVQPNVPQAEKWRPENTRQIFSDMVRLTQRPLDPTPDRYGAPLPVPEPGTVPKLIVWPEEAIPAVFRRGSRLERAVASRLADGQVLALGLLRATPNPDGGKRWLYNSTSVMDRNGFTAGPYDKNRLVPFGEYVPLKALLTRLGFGYLTANVGIFQHGTTGGHLPLGHGMPTATFLICYEVTFPWLHNDGNPGADEPGVLISVTNDAWFGDTSGPWQHLEQARARTIERGLPMIRSANTGISVVIDPFGRIRAQTKLNTESTIDFILPVSVGKTQYTNLGEIWAWLVILALIVISFVSLGLNVGIKQNKSHIPRSSA